MSLYRFISHYILFKFDPELIHDVLQRILSSKIGPFITRLFATNSMHSVAINLMGIQLRSNIALAAGFDKNCSMLNSLDKLGFGYIVGGTITVHPRQGNPKPRIARYKLEESMINSLGFPNIGLDRIKNNLQNIKLKTPLLLSISGDSIEEILKLYKSLGNYCAGYEINISSPNTERLKFFHDTDNLTNLLVALNQIKDKPYMLKIPRFENLDDIKQRKSFEGFIKLAISNHVDGIVLSNTLPIKDETLAIGKGGLSGKKIYTNTEYGLEIANRLAKGKIEVVASGGVNSSHNVKSLLSKGAKSVQIWTSLIYEGPGLVRKINKELS